MQKRQRIYSTVGSIFIALNIFGDFQIFRESGFDEIFSSIGYFIGSQFFLLFGLLLISIAQKLKKKMERKAEAEQINNIGNP